MEGHKVVSTWGDERAKNIPLIPFLFSRWLKWMIEMNEWINWEETIVGDRIGA